MISLFEDLLHQLGSSLGVQLHVDRKSACSIRILPELIIQLQLDASQESLFFFTKIAEIPPGRFREMILKDALKANAQADPIAGAFGYIFSTNELALFQRYPLSILDGERLTGLLGAFLEEAKKWQKAIKEGKSPFS